MLKKLVSQTAVYGLSSIFARLINYLLVPLHTHTLDSASDYGTIAYYYAFAALLNVLYTHGMETAFFRFSAKKKKDSKKIYNAALTSVLLVSLLLSGTIILFSREISVAIGYPSQVFYVRWFAYILAIDAVLAIPFARLRQENKAFFFAFVRIFMVLANVGLNFFFFSFCKQIYEGHFLPEFLPFVLRVYNPDLGAGYAFLSNFWANALAIPLLAKFFFRWRPVFSLAVLKPLWRYAYPLIFSGIAAAVNEVMDKILLKLWIPPNFYPHQSNMDAVGIYAACYKLSIFITLAVQAYRYAAEPFFFAKAQEKNPPKAYAKVMKYFVIVCALMMVGVTANLKWLADLFLGKAGYTEGLGIVPILLLANVFLGVYYNLATWFKVTDRTRFGAYIGIGGAVVTLLTNYWLIPHLGYFGAAWATLICYFSMSVACYAIGRKYYPIPYNLPEISAYLTVAALVSTLLYRFTPGSSLIEALPGNLLVALLCIFIFLKERKNLRADM